MSGNISLFCALVGASPRVIVTRYAFRDLQSFVQFLESRGQLKRVRGSGSVLEAGEIAQRIVAEGARAVRAPTRCG